jgi:Holliday junction resolvase
MSNPRKALGSSLERRVVSRAKAHGLTAHKQPLSGSLKEYPNDVVVQLDNGDALLGECKVRSRHPNFSEMQEWLEGCQANAKREHYEGAFLVYNVKGSRTPRVLLDLDLFLCLLGRQNATLDNNGRPVV